MNLLTSELLMYGGLLLAAVAVLLGIVIIISWKICASRLNAKFDREYGPREGK